MTIDWVSLQNVDKVLQVLEQNLDKQATSIQIRDFVTKQGLECSQPVEGIIYCSGPASSKLPLVRQKWLIQFHMSGDQLERIDVERGFIGP